jgi:hypothetical protein
VIDAKSALRLRDNPPPLESIKALNATGLLSAVELGWLAKGWWSPVAALRPAALIGRIETALDRAGVGDPDRETAAAVGFMTWPAAS